MAESLPHVDVPKWTIQCYFKWFWPHVTFLVIFLKLAIRLSSALTPLLQSHTQNTSRKAIPLECSAWAGVPAPSPGSPQSPSPHKTLTAHNTAAQTGEECEDCEYHQKHPIQSRYTLIVSLDSIPHIEPGIRGAKTQRKKAEIRHHGTD